MFRKAVAVEDQQDLDIYLTYADHLRFREQRTRCLEVVEEGLKNPLATRAAAGDTVMGLHAVAIESLLADLGDASRFEKAAPHIKALIGSTSSRYQGLGHLFQGAIDLEQSGVAGVAARASKPGAPSGPPQPKLRASALSHLKVAATQLPDLAEAQARYGVALVLSQEQGLGRQYLQKAMKLGNLDPQYQIWAAWSIVQAGYPEEAEPIVTALLGQVAQGRLSREMEATLLLLSGEIHQARRTPDDLKKALASYEKAIASGHVPTPSVQLRLAQIDVQLGQTEPRLARIEAMQAKGQGGASAEHLAVLILLDQKKDAEARARLDKARKAYPENSELVGLDASLRVKAEQPEEADRLLADFLVKQPENVGIVLMRAQLLAERLNKEDEARKLLVNVADRSDISAPLVQLALLDLKRRDYHAVATTIAKIRKRWSEAAAADLLEAQVALDQGDISAAVTHFDAALKKDPNNKLVQFWKAQLDSRNGSSTEAARAFEAITKDRPTKEIDPGLSLMAAAQSALANLALQNGDLDGAIHRFEDLRKGDDSGSLARSDRWQLVAAYSAKDQWPAARREIAALLGDPKAPPRPEERVRAANFYRLHKEEAAALGELDAVLKKDPAHPAAVVTRASMLVEAKKLAEASSLLRKAIDATPAGQKPPAVFFVMLAAVENLLPPATDGLARALTILERGLVAQPDSLDLVRAKYRVLLVDARSEGRDRLRQGEGRGRQGAPSRPPRGGLSRAGRVRRGGGRRPRAPRRAPEGRATGRQPRPARRDAGDRRGRAERPRAGTHAEREDRHADPRVPRAIPQRTGLPPGRVRPRRTPRRHGTRHRDHAGDGPGRQVLARRPHPPRPALRGAGQDAGGGRRLRRGPQPQPPPARDPRPARPGSPEARRDRRGGPPGQARPRRPIATGPTPCSSRHGPWPARPGPPARSRPAARRRSRCSPRRSRSGPRWPRPIT